MSAANLSDRSIDHPAPHRVDGSPTYHELNAKSLAAGDHNLFNGSWDISVAKIDFFSVTVATGSPVFAISFHETDQFTTPIRYGAEGLIPPNEWQDDLEWIYVDVDESNEIHLRITDDTGGAATYNVYVRGTKLLRPERAE